MERIQKVLANCEQGLDTSEQAQLTAGTAIVDSDGIATNAFEV